jgi:quercetin dioxygenase-like cupin family protein
MFHKAFFTKIPQGKIEEAMRKDGFSPEIINVPPGFIYEPHGHTETKYLVCLEGSMQVTVKGKMYDFEPGDKLIIDGNTKHSAIVGNKGCVFFWSEKIVR